MFRLHNYFIITIIIIILYQISMQEEQWFKRHHADKKELWQYRQTNWLADPISIYSTCTPLHFGMGVSKKKEREIDNKHTHIKTHLLVCQLPTHTPKPPPLPPHPQLSKTHLPAIVLHYILFSPLGQGLPVRPQGQLVLKQLQLLADCSWQTAK